MPIYAGIDIGTLTVRLLVARVLDGKLHELVSERYIAKLGEGLQPSRRLQAAPIARVTDMIVSWKPRIEKAGARDVVIVATSAVRDAVNRDEFLAEVKKKSGWEVTVLPGEEEARLSLMGIRSGLPADVERYVAVDIGGGSTEMIKASPGQAPAMVSVNEGVVRLTEDVLRNDPPKPEDLAAARTRIRNHLNEVKDKLGAMAGFRLVGTAGTITTLAAMDQKMESYTPKRIHNYRLSWDAVKRILGEMSGRTHAQRKEMKGLEPGREAYMVAGTLILLECMERFGFVECLVSDYGLREGILINHWEKSKE